MVRNLSAIKSRRKSLTPNLDGFANLDSNFVHGVRLHGRYESLGCGVYWMGYFRIFQWGYDPIEVPIFVMDSKADH